MKLQKSKPAAFVAGVYLLLVLVGVFPLVQEGYIGHGNGLAFLLVWVLTLPLSYLFMRLNDWLVPVNAFYVTGWPYVLMLCEFSAAALVNAYVIHSVAAYLHRKYSQ